jgi:hypothetical protein
MPQELSDKFSTCMWLDDNAEEAAPNFFHVEKTDQGYSCIRKVYTGQCYWTTASKLRYIGHGPQLTDEQFAEVLRLYAASDAFRKEAIRLSDLAETYRDRANKIQFGLDRDGESREPPSRDSAKLPIKGPIWDNYIGCWSSGTPLHICDITSSVPPPKRPVVDQRLIFDECGRDMDCWIIHHADVPYWCLKALFNSPNFSRNTNCNDLIDPDTGKPFVSRPYFDRFGRPNPDMGKPFASGPYFDKFGRPQ